MSELVWQAKWISADPKTYVSKSLPVFRHVFQIDKPIQRAVAYICGLGHFELQVNGIKAGDDVLEPAWSNYAKTCLYVSHDVTSLLRGGQNEMRVWLGNGMYNVTGGRYTKFKGSFGPPKLILQLQLDLADGSSRLIVSNESWQVAPGPITFSCIYGGEDYDARNQPTDWQPVALSHAPGWRMRPQKSPPIRIMQIFRPISSCEQNDGSCVYDLGQNFSGWVKLKVQARAGETIKLIPAELLNKDGLPDQSRVGSPVSFSYTCNGDGVEEWHPRFSYYGFRYVQVIGPRPIELEGQFIHNSAKRVGEFECSSDLFNRIHKLIDMAILSNFQHVLTDCPQREKLGWLEQSHLMAPAMLFNYDAASFYAKVSEDMRDAQHADGCVPVIAPQYTIFPKPWDNFNDSPEWGAACVLSPWQVYQTTGRRQILDDNYESMRRFVGYLASRAENHIIAYGLGDWYDHGPGDPGLSKLTTLGVTGTAMFYAVAVAMQRIADVLGRTEDSHLLATLAGEIRDAFNRRFFNPATNQYDTGSQTANAMPLALGLVDPQHRPAVLENLVQSVRQAGNTVTAGDIGFRYVIEALGDGDRSDVIFDMLNRTDSPSYGYQLAQGATTLTEAWDANPIASQNHLMLGHAEIWFYRYLAGIQIDLTKPQTPRIIIKPAIVGDLTWARAKYDSALGAIESHWQRDGSKLTLRVTVPAPARVHVPDRSGTRLHDVRSGTFTFESQI